MSTERLQKDMGNLVGVGLGDKNLAGKDSSEGQTNLRGAGETARGRGPCHQARPKPEFDP